MPENPLGTLTGSSYSKYKALKLNMLFEVPARVTKPWKKIQINVKSKIVGYFERRHQQHLSPASLPQHDTRMMQAAESRLVCK